MATGLSFVTYSGVAAQQVYTITFPSLRADHVFVDIDGVNTADITVNTARTEVTINTPAIAGGEFIKVYRTTPRTQAGRLVDFEAGSAITEADLDTTYLQLLYIVQESLDEGTLSLQRGDDGSNLWDAEGSRIINVGDPVDDQDAVTKAFLDSALVDNGNLPTVDGDDNDSMLLVVAGEWAVADEAAIKTALNITDGGLGAMAVVEWSDGSVWQDSTITSGTEGSNASFPDRSAARLTPVAISEEFNNAGAEIAIDAGNKEVDLGSGVWRITADIVIVGDAETSPPTVQWAVTDTTDNTGIGHANTIYILGEHSEVADTTPDTQHYMQTKTIIIDFASATSLCLRMGSSGTSTSQRNCRILFERLGPTGS